MSYDGHITEAEANNLFWEYLSTRSFTANDSPATYSYAGPEGLKPTTRRMVLSS